MKYGFIVALLVMVIITVFTFIILKMIAESTGSKIRDNVITQMQTYDVLIQKKSSELQAIQKQIDNEQSKLLSDMKLSKTMEQSLPGNFPPANDRFRNIDFSEDYRNLKEGFIFDQEKMIREVYSSKEVQVENDINILLAGLLEKFNFENVFKLSVLHSMEQLEVIREIISEEEDILLEDFIKQNREFSCLAFYQWLYVQKEVNEKQIRVRTAEKNINYSNLGESIKIEYDGNLCEGFQILTGNKLYDYGVRKCELL